LRTSGTLRRARPRSRARHRAAMRARTDPSWYRQEAERLCQRAATITTDDKLRDSYLSLACEYEKLAEDFGGPPTS
jgi:hypothetical protein